MSVEDHERWMECVTWIEEDGTKLRRSRRGVLDHREVCRSSGAVVIVHRNIEDPALQVGVRGINPEALTAAPRNLQGVQEA